MIHQKIILGNNEKISLTTYILDAPYYSERKPLIIVCPGGGFLDCSPSEGECVALHFNREGYHAAVLEYSTEASAPGKCDYPKPLYDMAEAIKTIRNNAEDWNVDIAKITILGFSAGGNLCALYENSWNSELLKEIGTSKQLKPNAVILCYPLTDGKLSQNEIIKSKKAIADMEQITGQGNKNMLLKNFWKKCNIAKYGTKNPTEGELEKANPIGKVNSDTPPTFIWTTFGDDILSPLHSINYAAELFAKGIPCELHIYEKGQHGLSLADKTSAKKLSEVDQHVATWSKLAVQWLEETFRS